MTTTAFTDGVTLTTAAWFNDVDSAVYPLTAVAGTNTITATGPASFTAYSSTNHFLFTPAVTNTGATTINIGGAGAKNIFFGGAACSGGELVAGVPALIKYDGTQFNIIGPTIGSRLTNSLSGDVSINNASNFFDGPIVAQGTVGTWFVSGSVTCLDTAGSANFIAKLWDGTTVIDAATQNSAATNAPVSIHLSGYLSSPAASLRISVKSGTTTGVIKFNTSGTSKDSTISSIRIG